MRATPPPDEMFMAQALRLARKAVGRTSPNPMVGAVLVRRGQVIGQGYHHAAGLPHAEVEALRNAGSQSLNGGTLYVTLEPCSTHGRTPPCTDAIIKSGVRRLVIGAVDPNPRHAGRGLQILQKAGIQVSSGVLARECAALNEAFNHWIVHRTPLVTVKSAMTLDGKIATADGQSKWITGPQSRDYAMRLRREMDAIVVGVNTVILDNPSLTVRRSNGFLFKPIRRIVLDPQARTPLISQLLTDDQAGFTSVVVSEAAPAIRVRALKNVVNVIECPLTPKSSLDLRFLLKKLGSEQVTSLLVEGGGKANAAFLLAGLAHRITFFYAPMILGGADSRKAVAGTGATSLASALRLTDLVWRKLGPDLLLTARVVKPGRR